MKRPILVALSTALFLSAAAFAVPTASSVRADTELEKHMKEINVATRTLRQALKDPARAAECMTLVLSMQTHALAAKALEPAKLATLPDAEKKPFMLDFRKEMHTFLNGMFAMEVALLEGDAKAAEDGLKRLFKEKAPAHKKFQLESEHDEHDEKDGGKEK